MGFHIHRNGQTIQYELSVLRDMARRGDLAQDEYIYDDKKGEWIGAAQVPEMTGAWNIAESEATVAMELPPDFGALFEAAASKPAAPAAPAVPPAPSGPAPSGPAPRAAEPRQPEPVRVSPQINQRPQQEERRLPEGGGGGGGGSRGTGGGFGGGRPTLQPGEILNPVTVVILSLVTCGIYPLIWMFKRAAEINTFVGREEIKTSHLIIGLFCFPFILMALWKIIKVLPEMGQKAGVRIEDRSTLLLICALCAAPAFYYLYQTDLNSVWEASGATPKS